MGPAYCESNLLTTHAKDRSGRRLSREDYEAAFMTKVSDRLQLDDPV